MPLTDFVHLISVLTLRCFYVFRFVFFSVAFATTSNAQKQYTYNPDAGRTNYMLQCQGCHKANGEGIETIVPGMNEHGAEMLLTERGRQFYVAVPGSSQSPLSDQRLADVLNYIVTELISTENSGEQIRFFDTSEVTKYRGLKMKDVAKERAQIVAAIERKKRLD